MSTEKTVKVRKKGKMREFGKILVFLKRDINPEIVSALDEIAEEGRKIFVLEDTVPDEETAEVLGKKGFSLVEKIPEDSELLLVLGGDGAILRACHRVITSGVDVPVLGVNFGRVGFLTYGDESLPEVFAQLGRGDFRVEEKSVVECIFSEKFYAINDFVIRSERGLLEFEFSVGGEFSGRVRADGILISTPLGSTAYNLSAGGPIVHPSAKVLVIGFLAPFTLSARPIVIPEDLRFSVRMITQGILFADGQEEKKLSGGDELKFLLSQKKIKIIKGKNSGFFDSLRKKFGWLL